MSREEHLKISCFILRLFLKEILKDGKIEAFEKEGFQTLVQKLGIPADLAKKEFDSVRTKLLANPHKGAIDYETFFTELNDNLLKVIPATESVGKILNQVAGLLKAETEFQVYQSLKESSLTPSVTPEKVAERDSENQSEVESLPQVESSPQGEQESQSCAETGLIEDWQTTDLGDGLYDLAKDKVHDGFDVKDTDLTNAGFFKGGE